MIHPRTVLLFCCSMLACNDYSEEECIDIRAQIVAALEENVNKGVLLPDAVSCGPDGVANRRESFDSRIPPGDVEYLQGAFRSACAEFLDNCN
jgi:hypothetical protein